METGADVCLLLELAPSSAMLCSREPTAAGLTWLLASRERLLLAACCVRAYASCTCEVGQSGGWLVIYSVYVPSFCLGLQEVPIPNQVANALSNSMQLCLTLAERQLPFKRALFKFSRSART